MTSLCLLPSLTNLRRRMKHVWPHMTHIACRKTMPTYCSKLESCHGKRMSRCADQLLASREGTKLNASLGLPSLERSTECKSFISPPNEDQSYGPSQPGRDDDGPSLGFGDSSGHGDSSTSVGTDACHVDHANPGVSQHPSPIYEGYPNRGLDFR